MNYLTGLILIGVNLKEDLAFTIIVKLMQDKDYDLRGIYLSTFKKLFELTDYVVSWLLGSEPDLEQHLRNAEIPLTTMLSGPFMALFANILDFNTCLLVLDRLILLNTSSLVNIVKHVF